MKRFALLIALLGLAASMSAEALQVESNCPKTVKSNTALVVPTKVTNDSCTSTVAVSKVVASLVGNGGGSIGIQGPFVKALTPAKTVPKAKCATYSGCTWGPKFCQYVVTPGVLNLSLTVVAKTPTTLNNTLALVSTGVMGASGKVDMGTCYLTVVP